MRHGPAYRPRTGGDWGRRIRTTATGARTRRPTARRSPTTGRAVGDRTKPRRPSARSERPGSRAPGDRRPVAVERRVASAGVDELVVRPLLHDPPALQHHDPVGVADRGE